MTRTMVSQQIKFDVTASIYGPFFFIIHTISLSIFLLSVKVGDRHLPAIGYSTVR